jgi:excinuclease ABC subunit B
MGVDPQPLRKKIADITDSLQREEVDTEQLIRQMKEISNKKTARQKTKGRPAIGADGQKQILGTIIELDVQMKSAASELKFELAARIRDEISELKKELRAFEAAGHA